MSFVEARALETSFDKGSDKSCIKTDDTLVAVAAVLFDEDLGKESGQLVEVGSEDLVTLI